MDVDGERLHRVRLSICRRTLSLLMLASLPGALSAATVSYTFGDGYRWPGPEPTLRLFDPALGRLQSMTVDIDAWSEKAYQVYTFDDPATLEITMGSGSAGFGSIAGVDFNVDLPAATNFFEYAPQDTSYAWVRSEGTTTRTYTTGLKPFIGESNQQSYIDMHLNVGAGDVAFYFLSGVGDVEDCHHCGDWGGVVTVTYQYSVPEPATWAMMASGLGLIGGRLRSRRKTSSVRLSVGRSPMGVWPDIGMSPLGE